MQEHWQHLYADIVSKHPQYNFQLPKDSCLCTAKGMTSIVIDIPMKISGAVRLSDMVGGQQIGSQSSFDQPQQNTVPQHQRAQRSSSGVLLKKGQKVSLSQFSGALDRIEVGLGWDLAPGIAYDLDIEAFLLDQSGKVIGDNWFVFYNQPVSPDGAVTLLRDNTTGESDEDDEVIQVELSRVHPSVQKILFIVTINEAKENGYNFSNVQNVYVRIVDKNTGSELIRFNLTDYYDTVCSMMAGEVYRYQNEWKFNSIGDGTADDLMGLCVRYGVHVMD